MGNWFNSLETRCETRADDLRKETRKRMTAYRRFEGDIKALEEEGSTFSGQRIALKRTHMAKLKTSVLQAENLELKFRMLALRAQDATALEQESQLLAELQVQFREVERESMRMEVQGDPEDVDLRESPDVPSEDEILSARIASLLPQPPHKSELEEDGFN
jgi:hypothetical protein